MLTLHHLENSRSHRASWALEELGLPYEIVKYARDPETLRAPPSLRAVHPLGKSPVLVDGEHALAESGAILEYLVETYGGGRLIPPPGSPGRLRYRYWLHYAEGSLMPLLLLKLVMKRIAGGPMPFFVQPVAKKVSATVQSTFLDPQLRTHLEFVERELGKSTYFAGDELTAADIQMSFPLEAARARAGVPGERTPRIAAFLERIHARPAYQRALERGGGMKPL